MRQRSASLLELVSVFAFEAETGVEFGSPLIIFPNLMKAGFPRLCGKAFPLVDVPVGVAIQFQKPRLLVPVPTV